MASSIRFGLRNARSGTSSSGGAAGSFALLAGAAAAPPEFASVFGPVPLLLAAVLFLWTPPHFWALAVVRGEDYRRAGIPMLPVVAESAIWAPVIFAHVLLLVTLSFGPLLFGRGLLYGLFTAIAGFWFLSASWRLMLSPSQQTALATFRASLGHFALLSLGVILDRGAPWPL